MVLRNPLALLAKDAIWIQVIAEPFKASGVSWKVAVEILLCVLPHLRLAIHRLTYSQAQAYQNEYLLSRDNYLFSTLSPLRRAFGRRLLQRLTPRPTSSQARPRHRSCRASSTTCTAGAGGNPLASPPKSPDGRAA